MKTAQRPLASLMKYSYNNLSQKTFTTLVLSPFCTCCSLTYAFVITKLKVEA